MKRVLLLAAFAASVLLCYSQKIKGKILDVSNNSPLSGATITVSDKTTTSDKNGMFSIDCQKSSELIISYIGYETFKQRIRNCGEVLAIWLSPSSPLLADVEITATSGQNKSLLYQPAAITKLSLTELKRGQGIFFDDVIQTSVPGVIMNRRTVSGGQQFNIRGYGNGTRGTRGISSNFDGQGYKVYLNDIPVTDAEGINTLDDIDFASIGDAEIVKGPAGTLYGQAIAGAINLKTVTPAKGKTIIGQDIMFGNYGLQRYTSHFETSGEKSSLLLNYGNQKSDGFSIHNTSHKDFVNVAGDFHPNEKQSINTFFGYSNSYDERLGELTFSQYQLKDYSGNIDYIKRNAHSHVVSFRAGLGHTYNFNQHIANTTTIFGTGFRSDVSSAGGWTDKTSINYGFRTSFDTKLSVGDEIVLSGITGMEIQKQDAQAIGYNMKQNPADTTTTSWTIGKPYWVIDAMTSNTVFSTQPTSFFTEWTLALHNDISVTAGIGLSTQKITLDDRFNPATATKPSHYDTTYKNMVSPHIAINKVFNKKVSVYLSYSKGYKAPVSSYFFVTTPVVTSPATPATGRVNDVLKPEKGNQIELGSKGTLPGNRLSYQLALFYTRYTDKMTSVAVPLNNTTTAYSYVINGGKQDHKGIEATIKYEIIKNETGLFTSVAPFINFTYSDFTYGNNFLYKTGNSTNNITTYDYSGLNVFGVPKIMNAAGIDAMLKNGIYASFSHLYRDGVNIGYETVGGISVLRKSDSYGLLNAKIGCRKSISARFDADVFFGINNIAGTQYPMMIFVNQLPDAYLPAPQKAVLYGGLNFKFRIR